jgi:hypothetical protein
MPLGELVAWQKHMVRIQAKEALMDVMIQHGKPNDTANMLRATASGMSMDEYNVQRQSAISAVADFQNILGQGKRRV